mmetsp:Transcript_26252/g.47413  ORF Transcript_26252/g.47413 Transcript_26252/m.47413 type:complete len:205 (+) Transcript_26252:1715-2329(+)
MSAIEAIAALFSTKDTVSRRVRNCRLRASPATTSCARLLYASVKSSKFSESRMSSADRSNVFEITKLDGIVTVSAPGGVGGSDTGGSVGTGAIVVGALVSVGNGVPNVGSGVVGDSVATSAVGSAGALDGAVVVGLTVGGGTIIEGEVVGTTIGSPVVGAIVGTGAGDVVVDGTEAGATFGAGVGAEGFNACSVSAHTISRNAI